MAELMNVRCAPAAPSALSLVAHLTTNTPAEFSARRELFNPDSLLTTQVYADYGGAKHQGGYQRCLHRTGTVAAMLQAGGQHGGGEGSGGRRRLGLRVPVYIPGLPIWVTSPVLDQKCFDY